MSKPLIRQRGARWDARVEVWADGARRTVSAGSHDSREAAEAAGWKLALRYSESPEQRSQAQSMMTLADWVATWLGILPETLKANSVSTYKWRMGAWILPSLGTTRLVAISSPGVRLWLDGLALGHRSKRAALTCLSAALEAARERGLVPANAAHGVTLKQSKARAASQRVKVWGPEDAVKLLKAHQGTAIEAVLVLGLYGGLRRGEMLGLEWPDVDWLGDRVHVQRQTVPTMTEGLLVGETPKNGESRWVSLPADAMAALARARDRDGASPARVVPDLTPRSIQKHVKTALELAGVEILSLHSLRHTCASLLLSQGVSLVATAAHLGDSPEVVLAYYSHLMPSDKAVCASTLQSVLRLPGSFHPDQPRPAVTVAER